MKLKHSDPIVQARADALGVAMDLATAFDNLTSAINRMDDGARSTRIAREMVDHARRRVSLAMRQYQIPIDTSDWPHEARLLFESQMNR